MSYGFLALGLQAQDKVITITNNRPEWNFIDMGLGLANLIHVPIYPTLSVEDYKCIIEHSDAKLIIIENETIFNIVNPAVQELEYKPIVYTINTIEGQKNLEEIKILGTNTKNIYSSIIEENKKYQRRRSLYDYLYFRNGRTLKRSNAFA